MKRAEVVLTCDRTLMSNYHDNEFIGFEYVCQEDNLIFLKMRELWSFRNKEKGMMGLLVNLCFSSEQKYAHYGYRYNYGNRRDNYVGDDRRDNRVDI